MSWKKYAEWVKNGPPKLKCYILSIFEHLFLKFLGNVENICHVFTKFYMKIFADMKFVEFFKNWKFQFNKLKISKTELSQKTFLNFQIQFLESVWVVVCHRIAKYGLKIWIYSKVINCFWKKKFMWILIFFNKN